MAEMDAARMGSCRREGNITHVLFRAQVKMRGYHSMGEVKVGQLGPRVSMPESKRFSKIGIQ